jgi:hypothetical protein
MQHSVWKQLEKVKQNTKRFLQRAQKSENLHEFLKESRAIIAKNEGKLGQLNMKEIPQLVLLDISNGNFLFAN